MHEQTIEYYMKSLVLRTVLISGLAVALMPTAAKAQSQLVDCSCLAKQSVLLTNACQAVIPDLCQFTNCFRSSTVPPSPLTCSQTPVAGTSVGPGSYSISLTISEPSGLSQSCALLFVVNPLSSGCGLSLICASNKTVQCGTAWTFNPPTWINACIPPPGTPSNGVVLTIVSTVTNGTCPMVITRTWQGVDDCGHTATCSQVVTVVDTTPPLLTCASNLTVVCGTQWAFTPPTAFDACCGSNVTLLVVSTTTNGLCPQVITRLWRATDCCSNSATCAQVVTVVDTTPPTINCGQNEFLECGLGWGFTVPIISDNCMSIQVGNKIRFGCI